MHDIVFIGHLCHDEDWGPEGRRGVHAGGAALYGAAAAARAGRRVAAHLLCSPSDVPALAPLRGLGVEVIPIPSRETTRVRVIHPDGNLENRRIVTLSYAGRFEEGMIPPLSARFVHLAGCNDHEFTPRFVRAMKERGYSLSADLQSFVRRNHPETGEMSFQDDPEAREVVGMLDRVKLDVTEARRLTGAPRVREALAVVSSWGCPEVVITATEGVHVRHGQEECFAPFTPRRTAGRTGRGDTTFGAYLAWRLDHDSRESARFAAALASLKMENPGPFAGSLEDVLRRMREGAG